MFFIVITYWNKSPPRIYMSPHSDTLSWFRANQSLQFLFNAACLTERQQIPILWSLVWPDWDSNRIRGEHGNHYTTDAVYQFFKGIVSAILVFLSSDMFLYWIVSIYIIKIINKSLWRIKLFIIVLLSQSNYTCHMTYIVTDYVCRVFQITCASFICI